MCKKCILILLDGAGDRSYQELDNKTPLQAAHTPFMNRLASEGSNGLYHASFLGQALPSEIAHFLMFGYDTDEFPGRGALEALGAGIKLGPRDVAILTHLVTIKKNEKESILEKSKPECSIDDIKELIRSIEKYEIDGITIRFIHTDGIRGILILRGNTSPFFTDSDPFVENRPLANIIPWHAYYDDKSTINTVRALKTYLSHAHKILERHPVNICRVKNGLKPINAIVTQRSGKTKPIIPFPIRYGLKGISIASGLVFQGLCCYLGLDFKKDMDTEHPGLDMERRLIIARKALANYDFIHVHTKAPDDISHLKNPVRKKEIIELLDGGIERAIGPLLDNPEVLVILTSDHSTPSSGPLIHSGEGVPITFYGNGVRRDKVDQFNEIDAAAGTLGTVRGKELIYLILNHLDKSKLKGIMDTPFDQPFWPGIYQPFTME